MDAEAGQELPDPGCQVEAIQGNAPDPGLLLFGCPEDDDPLARLRRCVAAEAGKTHRHAAPEAAAGHFVTDEPRPLSETGIEPGEARGNEPEDPGFIARGLDAGGKPPEPRCQRDHGLLDGRAGDDVRPEVGGERERRAVAHPRKNTEGPGPPVHPEDPALYPLPVHHRRRMPFPLRTFPQEELQREGPDVNTGRPFHGTSPYGSTPEPPACPS